MKKQRRHRRPASIPGAGSPRAPRAAPRPAGGRRVMGEDPVVVAAGGPPAMHMGTSAAPSRPRWEGRNRALLIGLFAFAATAFVTAIAVGVMVDLKEHGRTRLEALVGVGPSHAQNAP